MIEEWWENKKCYRKFKNIKKFIKCMYFNECCQCALSLGTALPCLFYLWLTSLCTCGIKTLIYFISFVFKPSNLTSRLIKIISNLQMTFAKTITTNWVQFIGHWWKCKSISRHNIHITCVHNLCHISDRIWKGRST